MPRRHTSMIGESGMDKIDSLVSLMISLALCRQAPQFNFDEF
ncbi:hypothetical protein PATSB16_05760 [Pandoraea thiooxydans]|nr:hypothetical protein PATSB16_05760 [Pandoraea thiooxydans]